MLLFAPMIYIPSISLLYRVYQISGRPRRQQAAAAMVLTGMERGALFWIGNPSFGIEPKGKICPFA